MSKISKAEEVENLKYQVKILDGFLRTAAGLLGGTYGGRGAKHEFLKKYGLFRRSELASQQSVNSDPANAAEKSE